MTVEPSILFSPFHLDPGNAQLWRGAQALELRPKSFAVLQYLLEHSGQLVTKEELLNAVWPGTYVSDALVKDSILEIRKALGDDPRAPQFIETVHRRGYRFIAAVQSPQSEVHSQEETKDWKPKIDPASSQASSLQPPASNLKERYWRRGTVALIGLLLLGIMSVGIKSLSFFSLPAVAVPSEQAPALPLPNKPSIVVLPFVNLSQDPQQEYFSDGITADLITDLSKLSGLFVIARNSAFTYKGEAVKAQEISRELGVRYVLEGSVQKMDSQVRVTAQLVDATTGYYLWAERYDRPLTDIFTLQNEIRRKIITALKVKLTAEERERFRRSPTDNLEAYDYYLRGVESWWRWTKESNAQARQMFEKAIELDPLYAGAYGGLGRTYFNDWFFLWSQDLAQSLEQALEMARQAIALDKSLPGPHQLLGYISLWNQQYERAVAEAEQAIALNPNAADGYVNLANILAFTGRPKESIGLIEKAMRLNPRAPTWYLLSLGFAYRVAGQYQEATGLLKRVLSIDPDQVPAHFSLAICYAELGQQEEARAEVAEVLKLNPHYSLEVWGQRLPFKDPAVLQRTLAALRKAGLK